MSLNYTVSFEQAAEHIIDVSLSMDNPALEGQIFRLPNWIPGSYMIRDFSRNIVSLKATSSGRDVPISKIDKSTWQLGSGLNQVTLNYRVYAWDLSVRAAHVDQTHAFFNGTSVFLSADGQENMIRQALGVTQPPTTMNSSITRWN